MVLQIVQNKTGSEPLNVFHEALNNVRPQMGFVQEGSEEPLASSS